MRGPQVLLAFLLCLGPPQLSSAQEAVDDIVAGPPEAAQTERIPSPDLNAAEQAAPAPGDVRTVQELPPDAGDQQPILSEMPPPGEEAQPSIDQMPPSPEALPPIVVGEPPLTDVAQPSAGQSPASPEEMQPPPDGQAPPSEEAEAVDQAAPTNPNPLSGLQLESLGATRSLPLFTPSRTPPAVDAPEPEVVAAVPQEPPPAIEALPPPLQLIGIVLTDADQTALLRNTSTGETLRLGSGDRFEEWTMTIVDARSVEFHSGDRVQDMKMFEAFEAPPPPSGEPSGEPFDPGPAQDPNNPLPEDEQPPQPDAGEPPSIDGQSDIVIPHHPAVQRGGVPQHPPSGDAGVILDPGQQTSSDTDAYIPADANPQTEENTRPADFAPQLGNTPILPEGALPDQSDMNVSQ